MSIVTNTKTLISCRESDLSVFFACKLRYCTGVWPFSRIERVTNSKRSLFNELERNNIYTVRIIRASTVGFFFFFLRNTCIDMI